MLSERCTICQCCISSAKPPSPSPSCLSVVISIYRLVIQTAVYSADLCERWVKKFKLKNVIHNIIWNSFEIWSNCTSQLSEHSLMTAFFNTPMNNWTLFVLLFELESFFYFWDVPFYCTNFQDNVPLAKFFTNKILKFMVNCFPCLARLIVLLV